MSIDLKAVLKNKAINQWRLYWLVAIPMSIVMVIAMLGADMSTGPGVSTMIQLSVRLAVPFIFLVVAISSLQIPFPGPIPAWLLRNRPYIGMCFATAMAWQGLFIFIMSFFTASITSKTSTCSATNSKGPSAISSFPPWS